MAAILNREKISCILLSDLFSKLGVSRGKISIAMPYGYLFCLPPCPYHWLEAESILEYVS